MRMSEPKENKQYMDKNAEKIFNEALETEFRKVRDSGMIAGSKAICGVVLKKARDTKKTEHKRLIDIINFCERSLGVAKNYKEN